jgi:hypothetical protein
MVSLEHKLDKNSTKSLNSAKGFPGIMNGQWEKGPKKLGQTTGKKVMRNQDRQWEKGPKKPGQTTGKKS